MSGPCRSQRSWHSSGRWVVAMNGKAMPTPMLNNPAAADLSQDNQIKILLAAYQKNAAELLAIEASQEKLIGLILGIYSTGLTLITAFLKDSKTLLQAPNHCPTRFAWMLIVVAL